jgi:hypothetical protein
MVEAEFLDADAFTDVLSLRQYTDLVNMREAKWDVFVDPAHNTSDHRRLWSKHWCSRADFV